MRLRLVLLICAGLLVVWGGGRALLAPQSVQGRFERDLQATWAKVWEITGEEVHRAGWPANARAMARSPQALDLARRLERVGRQAFAPAELAEPSSTQARSWMRDFLEVFWEECGGSMKPAPPLELELLTEDDSELSWALRAASGAISFDLEVRLLLQDGEPQAVRVASLWR